MSLPADPTLARMTCDLEWRMNAFRAEIDGWVGEARTDNDGLGLYRSRLNALEEMMAGLTEGRLRALYDGLRVALGGKEFFVRYREVQQALSAVQDVWGVFRAGFLLRTHPSFRPALDAANFIVADCFNSALDRAEPWLKSTPPVSRPAPPLVHLMTSEFPMAVYRGLPARHLGVRILSTQRVPVPVLVVPEDHIHCAWLLSFLYHEVGHLIDRELGLAAGVSHAIERLNVPDGRSRAWTAWAEEIVADVFGVLFGGPGFGFALAALLRAVGPTLPADRRYPPYWLRTQLLAELIRQHGAEAWGDESAQVRVLAHPAPQDRAQAALLEDVGPIAGACLTAPLETEALRGPSLRHLAPDAAADCDHMRELAHFLATGQDRPGNPETVPCRLVPAAAALAVVQAEGVNLEAIHERAVEFAADTDRDTYMDGAPPDVAFYQELTRRMTLAPLGD
jgi:hypothetical protein